MGRNTNGDAAARIELFFTLVMTPTISRLAVPRRVVRSTRWPTADSPGKY
jgi:hypothetical protein